MPVELWFPTPIYYYQFTDNILKTIQDEIVRYVPDLEDTLTSPWDDSVLTTFKYVDNINFLDNAPILKEQITQHVQKFVNSNINFDITDSWLNVCKQYGYQNYHSHPLSDVSGTYYFQITGNDGNIKFKPESISYQSSKLLDVLNVSKNATYMPKIGQLLLFPSFLEHAVLMNNTEDDRISISFNIHFK
jgi:uncharacterized protein (TIGR02466 family)